MSDRHASVAIMGALALPILIGIVALVAEYGGALLQRVENQRTADLSAYAAATAYSADESADAMKAAAYQVAQLNGVAAKDLTVNLVDSPKSDGQKAVSVVVATSRSLVLAPVLGVSPDLKVKAGAFAELGKAESGPSTCILALDGSSSGVTLSGGTSVKADDCSVASNATVQVPCGTTITAEQVSYNSASPPSQGCGGIKSPDGTAGKIVKVETPDPFANSSAIAAAAAHALGIAGSPSPSAPTGGGAIDFAYNQSSTMNQAKADGCQATFAQPKWTLNCTGSGPFNFGAITEGGGINVDFNVNGSANAVYNFSQGIKTGGGTTTRFGAGTFNIGKGSGGYSIDNASTLTFAGPSKFNLSSGVRNGGGGTLNLGSGSANSFDIGKAGDGYAINTGGGSKTVFADATGGSSVFRVAGNVTNGGGSCLTLSAATSHDIDGSVSAAGGLWLGAGVYSVSGYFALGDNGGGSVSCNGRQVGLYASDVTLAIAGNATSTSYNCRNTALCIGAGYSNVTLIAPDDGSTSGLAVVGPSRNSNGATLSQGASGVAISGLFYFPDGPISLTGGAGLGSAGVPGGCLQIVGKNVSLSGGTTTASDCVASADGGSSASGAVTLVQ